MTELAKQENKAGKDMIAFYQRKAKEAKEALSNNKSAPKISVVDKVKVEFIRDDGQILKGHTQIISQLAYEVYKIRKSVKKID